MKSEDGCVTWGRLSTHRLRELLMNNNQKLELTWIGKDQRPRLEPRILLEDPTKSYPPMATSKSPTLSTAKR